MAAEELRIIVERIERISEEIAGLQEDRRDIFSEAKARGFSASTIRKVIQRRRMKPEDRMAVDAELETYELALAGEDDGALAASRPDAHALATAMLAEQVAGMDDPESAEALVGHMAFLLEVRAEIRVLRGQESDRKKQAKTEGFLPPQMAQAVRWFEKVEKHGLSAMQAGEATYRLYRSTFEAHDGDDAAPTSDPKLAAAFPAKAKPNAKGRALSAAQFAAAQTARALKRD